LEHSVGSLSLADLRRMREEKEGTISSLAAHLDELAS
jgi:hypothetical protein